MVSLPLSHLVGGCCAGCRCVTPLHCIVGCMPSSILSCLLWQVRLPPVTRCCFDYIRSRCRRIACLDPAVSWACLRHLQCHRSLIVWLHSARLHSAVPALVTCIKCCSHQVSPWCLMRASGKVSGCAGDMLGGWDAGGGVRCGGRGFRRWRRRHSRPPCTSWRQGSLHLFYFCRVFRIKLSGNIYVNPEK